MLILVVGSVYVGGHIAIEGLSDTGDSDLKILVSIFGIIFALLFSLLTLLVSLCYRRSCIRVLGCPNKDGSPTITTQIFKNLVILSLALATSGLNNELSYYEISFFSKILLFRSFNRIFHAPLTATLEFLIILFYMVNNNNGYKNYLLLLLAISFGLNRLKLLINKLDYVVVSLITAYSNTK